MVSADRQIICWLLLLTTCLELCGRSFAADGVVAVSDVKTCASGPRRKVRFWVGDNGAGGVGIVNRTTNTSCSEYFLANLTKYRHSIDSIGVEMWKLGSNASGPVLTLNDGSTKDDGMAACLRHVKQQFNISVGICGTTDATHLNVGAANPAAYGAAVREFLEAMAFEVDELWTDFEVKQIGAGTTKGANEMHALMQKIRPTFRYAGCEPRDPPYLSENCSSFVKEAPGVMVQAANTYWSTQISSGFYKGFNGLLAQEIANIGSENTRFLSPAICPDCASGANADNTISQQQLYERMDLMCSVGITDLSVFTFFEVVQRMSSIDRRLGGTLAERYFRAFEYFRTGKKPIG